MSGATLHWWATDPHTCDSCFEDLQKLLNPRTRLVAVTHVSNLIGCVLDLEGVVKRVRQLAPRARIIVDGVSHR